jgi:hypothetical protein
MTFIDDDSRPNVSWVRLGNELVDHSSQPATAAAVTVAHIGLEFDCLGVKSPLCIYKQREGGRC